MLCMELVSVIRTHLIPILAKTSSAWKDFPCPFPPQTPRMSGTYKNKMKILNMHLNSAKVIA